jgi:integrase
MVPVHPALVRLGFIDYVEMQRAGGRLFPEIKPGPRGNLSHYPSRFWQRYLKRIGTKRKGLALHSFRHTFIDECRRAGVPKEVIQGLVGHSDGSQTGHYGREQSGNPQQRWHAISSLSFYGLANGLPKPVDQSDQTYSVAA